MAKAGNSPRINTQKGITTDNVLTMLGASDHKATDPKTVELFKNSADHQRENTNSDNEIKKTKSPDKIQKEINRAQERKDRNLELTFPPETKTELTKRAAELQVPISQLATAYVIECLKNESADKKIADCRRGSKSIKFEYVIDFEKLKKL